MSSLKKLVVLLFTVAALAGVAQAQGQGCTDCVGTPITGGS